MTSGKAFPTLPAAVFGAFAGGVIGVLVLGSKHNFILLVVFTLVSIAAAVVITGLLITDADRGRDMEETERGGWRTSVLPERDDWGPTPLSPPPAPSHGGLLRGQLPPASARQQPYTQFPEQPDPNEPPRRAPGPIEDGDTFRQPPLPPAPPQPPGLLKPPPPTLSGPKHDPLSNQQHQRPGPIPTTTQPEPRAAVYSLKPGDQDQWWNKSRAADSTATDDVAALPTEKVQARPVSDYQDNTLIAQCPRCGAFEIELGRSGAGFDFTCLRCSHAWQWQPNTAWPETNVSPRRRGLNQS